MEEIIKIGFLFLAGIIVLGIILASGLGLEGRKADTIEELTKNTKSPIMIANKPDASLSGETVSEGDYGKPNKYKYRIRLAGVGLKNSAERAAVFIPVISLGGDVSADENSVSSLGPGEQGSFEFEFELDSSDPPMIEASVLGDEKNYIIRDDSENDNLYSAYQQRTALLDGQLLYINGFLVKMEGSMALRAAGMPVTFEGCRPAVSVKCRSEFYPTIFHDYYRINVGKLCEMGEDNFCGKSLSACDRTIDIELLRSELKCEGKGIRHIKIEMSGDLTQEDEKNALGKPVLLSLWKPSSSCWKNPLAVQPGCEEDFFGAYEIIIPPEKYYFGAA